MLLDCDFSAPHLEASYTRRLGAVPARITLRGAAIEATGTEVFS
jgi:hypothetical protein